MADMAGNSCYSGPTVQPRCVALTEPACHFNTFVTLFIIFFMFYYLCYF